MRSARILTLCLLMASLLPLRNARAQDNNYLIVPGERVGRWQLGKPLDSYGFGQQTARWEGTASGWVYYDGYDFPQRPQGPFLSVYTCRSDSLVMAILVVRRVDATPQADPEELKYGTVEGLRIGMEENEVVKVLGRPDGTWESTARQGRFEILVRGLDYWSRGLFVRINKADFKAFAIGAAGRGGFSACQQAVLGSSTTAQQPSGGGSPATAASLKAIASGANMRLADDIRITPPEPGVPPQIAAASGMWDGTKDCFPRQIFVFEAISAKPATARVFYAWRLPAVAGWTRLHGTYGSDLIMVRERYTIPQGTVQKLRTFRVVAQDTLRATNSVTGAEGNSDTACDLSRIRE